MIAEHVQPIDRVKSEKAFERGITMTNIRRIVAADGVECGRILHAAFSAIAEQHNFPPDFPSVDVATGVASMLIEHPGEIVAREELRQRLWPNGTIVEFDVSIQPHHTVVYRATLVPLIAR